MYTTDKLLYSLCSGWCCGLDNQGIIVWFQHGARDFFPFQNVQTDSVFHPASYSFFIGASSMVVKQPCCEADHPPPLSALAELSTVSYTCIPSCSFLRYRGYTSPLLCKLHYWLG